MLMDRALSKYDSIQTELAFKNAAKGTTEDPLLTLEAQIKSQNKTIAKLHKQINGGGGGRKAKKDGDSGGKARRKGRARRSGNRSPRNSNPNRLLRILPSPSPFMELTTITAQSMRSGADTLPQSAPAKASTRTRISPQVTMQARQFELWLPSPVDSYPWLARAAKAYSYGTVTSV